MFINRQTVKRYVINTQVDIRYFLFLIVVLVYFAQEYTPIDLQSHGIYILAQKKLVQ